MDRSHVLRLGAAIAFLVIIVVVLNPQDVLRELGDAKPEPIVFAVVSHIGALSAWGLSLAILCGDVQSAPKGKAFIGGYSFGILARSLVPWGRSAGAVFTAYGLSRGSEVPTERLLAAALANDTIRLLLSTAIAGTGAVALTAGGTDSGQLDHVLLALVIVGGMVLSGTLIVMFAPSLVTRLVFGVASVVRVTVGRFSSRVRRSLDPESIRRRSSGFNETVHDLARSPSTLLFAVVVSALGWVFALLALAFSLQAIGVMIAPALILLAVPAAGLAGIVPLPGGTGGIEAALIGFLVAIGGLPVPVAVAGTLLYRAVTFWFTLIASGISTATLLPTGLAYDLP